MMTWRYKILGGHTHVRVFMNGAKCGDVCFRNSEFKAIHIPAALAIITFVNETPEGTPSLQPEPHRGEELAAVNPPPTTSNNP